MTKIHTALKGWTSKLVASIHQYLLDFVEPKSKLNVGDHWYVRLSDGSSLVRIKLLDVTEHTVKVEILEGLGFGASFPQRFAIADLQWVELISGD